MGSSHFCMQYTRSSQASSAPYLCCSPCTGTLAAGCELQLGVLPGPNCTDSAYLQVELWDLGQLMLKSPVAAESKDRADPLLGMAQGVVPAAVYKGPSSWDIQPPQALFDTTGYELTAHYMRTQVI